MSRTVHVDFEVRSTEIMKRTLEQLGVQFSERGETITAKNEGGYREIQISANKITYDNTDERHVNKIKQAYSVNFYKDQAIKEGMQLREEKQANGTVVLTLLR